MLLEAIIMAYKPDHKFFQLIDRLNKQELKPDVIRVFLTTDDETETETLRSQLPDNIVIDTVAKSAFGHGRTRQLAALSSSADYVLFMTQDAVPADRQLTKLLIQAINTEGVAVAYARQLPNKSANACESYARRHNYPATSQIKSFADLETMGIKAAFCSDVCAIYNMSIFRALEGFDKDLDFNEDMIFAYKSLTRGYKVYYCADAAVYHSHNFKLKDSFKRYRDNARSQKLHPEIFTVYKSESAGMTYYKEGLKYFLSRGQLGAVFLFTFETAVKYCAYIYGSKFT